jgi:signal transduction histidine kinase
MMNPPRPSFIRNLARAFVRGYIRYGRTAWWRILLGLAVIFSALVALITIPTHHGYITAAKNKAERDAVTRVVKQAAMAETKRIGFDAANVVVDETPNEPVEPPEPPAPTIPSTSPERTQKGKTTPEPPALPSNIEKASAAKSGNSVVISKDGIKFETPNIKIDIDDSGIAVNPPATDEDIAHEPKGDWSVKIWGLTFTEREWDKSDERANLEPLLTSQLQSQIESAARFDVRKAFFGAFALVGFSVLSLVLLIVRGFAGRSARQTQRVKVVEAAAKVDTSARLIAEAQLKALQAQVEPHFLFNTLAHVKALQEIDVKQAGSMLDHLITYLRTALPNLREGSSTLGKEFELAQSYLNILKLRMGDRLTFSLDLPESLKTQTFPPALIINLVENAIKHGVERARAGGSIRLNAQRVGDLMTVTVSDTGRGLDPEGTKSSAAGSGVGLSSIRDRMKLLYGDAGRLTLEPNSPSGVIATLTLPVVVPDITPQVQNPSQPQHQSTNPNVSECKVNVALMIGLIGGIVGAHNWYLRRRFFAVVQGIVGTIGLTSAIDGDPVVFMFILLGTWLAVDLVLIATKSMKDGSGKLVTIEK